MPVLFFYLLLFGGAVLALAAMLTIPWMVTRRTALNSQQRLELRTLRTLVQTIDELAYRNRDVNPELSVQILDEIGQHKDKELEP